MARSNKVVTSGNSNPVDQENSELVQKDFLDDFFFHAANYLYKKRKLFITLGVACLAIFIAGYGISKYMVYQEDQRDRVLFKIEKIIYNSKISQDEIEKQALPVIDSFLKDNSGAKQATLALFYRGSILYKAKEYPKAQVDLEKALVGLQKSSPLFVLGSVYLSNVLRDQKKFDEAISVLEKAKSGLMVDIVMMELSEAYISNDNPEKAKETLQIFVKDYPKSQYIERAKQLLAML